MENSAKLIEILTKETQSLKVQFVDKSREYAKEYYNILLERKTWKNAEWAKYLGVELIVHNEGRPSEFLGFPIGFYNSSKAVKLDKLRNEIIRVSGLTEQQFIDKAEKDAVNHYENSIKKLSLRIVTKGLIIDKVKAVTSHIGVNIETTLTDGFKTVRAFTIIASGEIQQPHYRYLIK